MARQFLNIFQIRKFFGFTKRQRDTAGARAAGTTDTVYVGFRNVRQFVVDYVRKFLDIDTAGSDVGSNQNADFTAFKVCQRSLPCILRFIAVNGFCLYTGFFEVGCNFISAVFRTGKYQHGTNVTVFQQMFEQVLFIGFIYKIKCLSYFFCRRRNGSHLHAQRIGQDRIGQVGNLRRHSGREEQRLTLYRKFGNYLFDIMDEAHVEHAVGFVKHENFHIAQRNITLVHQVEQTTRGSGQDIAATLQAFRLCELRYTSEYDHVPDTGMPAICFHTFVDLDSQFAGRRQNKAADGFMVGRNFTVQQLQDRKCESSGFSSSGLGATQKVAAL